VAAIRLGAVYGCKYAAKDWAEEMLTGGAHRYEVAQGFQPDERWDRFGSLDEAMLWLHDVVFGGWCAAEMWSSADSDDWDAPPAYTLRWDSGLDPRTPGG
jgi:hypothetical protein